MELMAVTKVTGYQQLPDVDAHLFCQSAGILGFGVTSVSYLKLCNDNRIQLNQTSPEVCAKVHNSALRA